MKLTTPSSPSLLLLFAMSILIVSSSVPASAQRVGTNPENYVDSIRTVGGLLRIVKRDTSFKLELEGRVVDNEQIDESMSKSLLAPRYSFGDVDAVLLWISGMGSHSGGSLKVVSVKKDGSVSISPSDFIGTGALPIVTRQGNSLVIHFPAASPAGEGLNPATTWIWQNGQIRKAGRNVPTRSSTAETKQQIKSPAFIRPQHTATLQSWLSTKPGWRPATIDDAFAGETQEGREYKRGEIAYHGRNFHPYYAVADFNQDGYEDFAIILINEAPRQRKFAFAIFNGPFVRNQLITPAFYSEDVSTNDWLVWVTDDRFGKRFIVGPPGSDAGFVVRPRGKRYVIE